MRTTSHEGRSTRAGAAKERCIGAHEGAEGSCTRWEPFAGRARGHMRETCAGPHEGGRGTLGPVFRGAGRGARVPCGKMRRPLALRGSGQAHRHRGWIVRVTECFGRRPLHFCASGGPAVWVWMRSTQRFNSPESCHNDRCRHHRRTHNATRGPASHTPPTRFVISIRHLDS